MEEYSLPLRNILDRNLFMLSEHVQPVGDASHSTRHGNIGLFLRLMVKKGT